MDDRLHKRLARLLALAIDQEGTPEGDLARAKAERLAEALGVEPELDPVVLEVVEVRQVEWARYLTASAARLAGGVFAWEPKAGGGTFAGRRSSWLLFEHLLAHFMGQHKRRCAEHRDACRAAWEAYHAADLAVGYQAIRTCVTLDFDPRPAKHTALRRAAQKWSAGFAKAIRPVATEAVQELPG